MKRNKRKERLCALLLTATLFLTACGQSATAAVMQLIKTEGTVNVLDDDEKDVSIIENMKLYSGYQVGTVSQSYAWINLDSVKLVKMDEDSDVKLQKNGKKLEIYVNSGSLFFNITEPLAEDETLNIHTSTMIVGIRGTCGWVEILDDERFNIFLLEGSVECTASNTDIYGNDTWTVNAKEKAAVLCSDGVIEVNIEPLKTSDIPAYVSEEELPQAYEELASSESDVVPSKDVIDSTAKEDEMPEPTPGESIEHMYGSYVNEEGRRASIGISSSPSTRGETELIIYLDEKTAKFVILEQEEENVYRGIGPYDTQVYWVVFDSAGLEVTPLAAADDDYRRIAGYYRQTEIYIEETNERIPVSEAASLWHVRWYAGALLSRPLPALSFRTTHIPPEPPILPPA